jgi:MFS family permease
MAVTVDRQAASAADRVALFATLVAAYLISQFLRNSIGVIAPDIAAEMSIPASDIGVLSSVFFFAFAAVQLPLGVAIDRFGPKRCMLACTAVVIASALMFAAGRTPAELVAARVVMGVGTSCYLIAPLALYARRFPPGRFAMLAGLHMDIGTLGTLLATAPLAFAVAAIGWRASDRRAVRAARARRRAAAAAAACLARRLRGARGLHAGRHRARQVAVSARAGSGAG